MSLRARRRTAALFVGNVTPRHNQARIPTGEATPFGVTRNWSRTGVFIETPSRPAIGSEVEISFVWGDDAVRSRARVARHTEDGLGLAFVDPPANFAYAVKGVLEEVD